ncbi:MAG: hypothetical protein OXC92_03825 [Flavobacteriaceae bacterium]|nr:hypothetical protein [Flavobacteriaceae bacterium]
MKRIFILFAAVASVAAGCKNYDDRFDDLNNQITTLAGQVQTLQGVAQTVSALQTTIAGIRESVRGDINTAVGGVSTVLGTAQDNLNTKIEGVSTSVGTALDGVKTALDTTQKDLEDKVTALQQQLKEAADKNLSQADVDKLKTDLADAQKKALDAALATIQGRLGELETALKEAQTGALSTEELANLKKELEEAIAASNKDLKDALSTADFYTGEVNITTTGQWVFIKNRAANATQFNGNITINTGALSDTEVDELIAWVADIKFIVGDLSITHTNKDKPVKFGSLQSVTDLKDTQPHAHYPELTGANEVTLNVAKNKILTVKFPKMTSTKFTGDVIHLPIADEITIGINKYNAPLTIEADEGDTVVELDALATVDTNGSAGGLGSGQLKIEKVGSVSLAALRSLPHLNLLNAKSVSAPKVKAAILTIGEDVDEVNVGTADDSHINRLIFSGASDLETLQIGGNPTSDSRFRTDVTVNAQNTPNLEKAHIHGAWRVNINGLEDFEEIVTAGTIPTLFLVNTDVEGEVVLGHESGPGSLLHVKDNEDLEVLIADKVNKLKNLDITGNHNLERISFAALKEGSPQSFGNPNWYDGDAVIIGGTQYDANGPWDDGNYHSPRRNNLFADAIHLEVTTGPSNQRQPGNVVDSSGLSDLKAFLSHENIRRALVSYDGASTFKPNRTTTHRLESNEDEVTNKSGDDFILIRKGLRSTDAGARRVFLVSGIDATSNLSIKAGSGTRAINLTDGGTYNNYASDVNDDEVKNFFDSNGVTISARAGGYPQGEITVSEDSNTPTFDASEELTGSITLTIGEGNSAITSRVVVQKVVAEPDEDDDYEVTELGTSHRFANSNDRLAVTYINADDSDPGTDENQPHTNANIIRTSLIDPFTIYDDTASGITNADNDATADDAAENRIFEPVHPYGINDFAEVTRDGETNIVAIIGILDAQAIDKKIKVSISSDLGSGWDLATPTKKDIDNRKNEDGDVNTLQITLTSQTVGSGADSKIGDPKHEGGNADDFSLVAAPGVSANNAVRVYGTGAAFELPIHKRDGSTNNIEIQNYRNSSLPRKGADVDSFGGNKDLDRLGWIG